MYPPDSGQAVQKVNTPGACHKGISDTGELTPRIRSIFVELNHQVERAISTLADVDPMPIEQIPASFAPAADEIAAALEELR